MHSFESKTHSFIVKVWLEEAAEEAGRDCWRGHITRVPDGDRGYLNSLEIAAFIAPYLEERSSSFHPRGRLFNWLNRWRYHGEWRKRGKN